VVHVSSVVHALYACTARILPFSLANASLLVRRERKDAAQVIHILERAVDKATLSAVAEQLKKLRVYIIRCYMNSASID